MRPPTPGERPNALTLLTGPVASGKSRLAAQLASVWRGPVEVIVTAEARDEEMRARIERHRAERPDGWKVAEAPLDLSRALNRAGADAFVIVDCLTLWTSNRMGAGDTGELVVEAAGATATVAAARRAPTVVVTNEVGWGIVPVNDLARAYREVLGRVNAEFADRAARAMLVVAGRVVPLQIPDPATLLSEPSA
ncbi:MAG TPA: bifunctional adenosylcobinamide kinase/adenosylcobinamide-phosphate guanylyltransferase [Actinomycetota bacterium]|nr:bifunctional adenosylcobinamide kinase/adenosylcobinamide-phosphate guanylyltransferase [Actinomycetota bacterium]